MKSRKRIIIFIILSSFSSAFCQQGVAAKVLLGIDVLKKENFKSLRGKKIGLITNHTGVDSKGVSTIDLLHQASGIKLVALFSPEHGIRGKAEHGEKISDSWDKKTGLPIYSLYGKTQRPTEEMLTHLDALIFDIQDIGTRFYTYITTLAYALEEAAKRNIEFFVLDRPNPISGTIVEGEILEPAIKHFTAYLQIPVRHGMTVGELAHWYNRTSGLNAKLTVIKMEGWKREMFYNQTGLKFRPPSPNIRNLRAALLYPGIGAFEATNVSVGRGSKIPFEIFGAPWIVGALLAERLNFLNLSGVEFKPIQFVPQSDLYQGMLCEGVKIVIKDRNLVRPVDIFIQAFCALRDVYPGQFRPRWEEIERVVGSKKIRQMLEQNQSAETVLFFIHNRAVQFEQDRAPYLLYE